MSPCRWSQQAIRAVVLTVTALAALASDPDAAKMSTGDTETDGVIVSLQEKLKTVATCRADVITRLTLEGEVYTIEDSAMYRVPGRFRLERSIGEDVRQTIVADGSLLWIHDHAENMVSRVNLSRVYKATGLEADGDQPDPTRPFRGVEWTSIRYAGTDSLGGEACQAFEGSPKPISLFAELPVTPDRIRLLVHPEDGLARQAQYLTPDGQEVFAYRFTRVAVNPKLSDDVFEFVVPARALVMDATAETIELLQSASGAE